ncbi:NUDIX hydrolase [Tropicimonas isoalkanivorans]|uniref:NUDIX domain-containing protein n=1 Tax=Tropicimonas isoalkanivorans TaxID=441112 RepID=A0A1I1LB20_9RHOB|nr:NUDIX hydrolase [Tropicimonas isoalkanivorans]SFC70294.1 NUDIX domain-containing protein [Tropicimonas isoalkanivorans]
MSDTPAIRDASTVILWRGGTRGPEVLMGQRGSRAVFMPNKFVFPGGAIDAADAEVRLAGQPDDACLRRLALEAAPGLENALLAGAIREVWEETGLILGRPDAWDPPSPDWEGFAATGHAPSAAGFAFVFRAITPPARPRRFDARFFLVSAEAVQGDPEDFSRACDELSHLQWVPLSDVRQFDLPFITEVVLGELAPLIGTAGPPESVPMVRNDDVVSGITRLR